MIDQENNQLGIVPTREAIIKARDVGLDLVEVAPTSDPPVCRITVSYTHLTLPTILLV